MSQTIPSQIRSPEPEDISFIYSTWLKSYQRSSDNKISGSSYFRFQKNLIAQILDRSLVSIACDPLDSRIYSYAVYEILGNILVLHWIYTKFPFRSFGFAGDILRAIYSNNELEKEIIITHRGVGYWAMKDKFSHIYKPELAFKK